jgi:hypothetical protein
VGSDQSKALHQPFLLAAAEVPAQNKQGGPGEVQEGSAGDPDQGVVQDHLGFGVEIQA